MSSSEVAGAVIASMVAVFFAIFMNMEPESCDYKAKVVPGTCTDAFLSSRKCVYDVEGLGQVTLYATQVEKGTAKVRCR